MVKPWPLSRRSVPCSAMDIDRGNVMRGVVFTGNSTLATHQFPDPHAGPGEAVLAVRASGLCGTDLHAYHNPEPSSMNQRS